MIMTGGTLLYAQSTNLNRESTPELRIIAPVADAGSISIHKTN
jgi:hypothetical protein